MTTERARRHGTIERDPVTGEWIMRFTRVEIAAARARLEIGKRLGIEPSEALKAVAALDDGEWE